MLLDFFNFLDTWRLCHTPKCTFFCAFEDDAGDAIIGGVSGKSENMEKCNCDGIWEGYSWGGVKRRGA